MGVEKVVWAEAIMFMEASTPVMWAHFVESCDVRTPSPQPRSRIVSDGG